MSSDNNQKLSGINRLLLLIGAAGLIVVLFVPMWRIELDAPQYPEGLELLINPGGLAGDVDIINGLNHYIGMRTLHTEDFYEFKVLPYLILFFSALFALVSLLNRRKYSYVLLGIFVVFSVLAMYDFWKWEYDYGHNLDDNAAIKVPGMAYQPPLIGFKQLLNFGAYSIPDTGGWLFILAGVILLYVCFTEYRKVKRIGTVVPIASLALLFLAGCSEIPEPIIISKDQCVYCRMTIEDPRFACELVSDKNKVMKFDDIFCVLQYVKEGKIRKDKIKNIYLCDYVNSNGFILADSSKLLLSDNLQSPMNGNIAAFSSSRDLQRVYDETGGMVVTWARIFE